MADSVPFDVMETYLVGGAVRDKLLGLPVVDKDWVIVGETPSSMLQAGYIPVGKDFPVFLHPETHEEYALARTERKVGPGYHGFEFDTGATVTLEEDLSRRDLTINAIAEHPSGELIDPFNGAQDLEHKLLRHVSSAFSEDPVRILRVAKFMARFAHLGFSVHDDTVQLMTSMVHSGEVDNLVAERVWKELEQALGAQTPAAFFTTLASCEALNRIIPEWAHIQPTYLEYLDKACSINTESRVRFASMCGAFPNANSSTVENLCARLRVPSSHSELAIMCVKHAQTALSATSLNAEQLHALLKSLDARRRPERFSDFILTTQVLAPNNADELLQTTLLQASAQALNEVDVGSIAKQQTDKSQIPVAIKLQEIEAIKTVLSSS